MAKTKAEFDDLLSLGNFADLRAGLSRWPAPLSLPQVQRLSAHARSLGNVATALRIGIVHTYTSDLIEPWLALWGALNQLDVQAYHAPYGLALQEADAQSGIVAHRPDMTWLMLRREDLHPDLALPLAGLDRAAQDRLRTDALARLKTIIELFRAQNIGQLLLTFLPAMSAPALGTYDAQSAAPESAWWGGFKSDVGRWMRESVAASLFLDLDEVLAQVGRDSFFDRRYWYSAQFPTAAPASLEIARRVVNVGVLLKTPRAKVLVLDADNTLWGGVVGEDGFDGIAIGPDYPGATYRDFQRRILDFQQRGFILAMCSKNNPADVEQVLRDHPHQILRDRHFAARRVNWLPKSENLISLAKELNLGLESFIFVDDSDHECAAMRLALPMVEVIQTPSRPVDVPGCLDHVARLEVLALTGEDAARTEMYAQERQRRELSEGASAGDYLAQLGMAMRISLDAEAHVRRLSQLTQKTNQFNLTTRRYDEQQVKSFIADPNWLVADFSLADVFGDSGIVGLALLRTEGGVRAELDNFMMSCRVIGRQAESAFLQALLRHLAASGFREIAADFIPTAKNELAKSFLVEQGFVPAADGRYHRDLHELAPRPESDFPITIRVDAAVPAAATF